MDNVMNSQFLSRFLPVADGDVSVYESIRRHAGTRADVEAQQYSAPDEEFHDEEEDDDPDALLYDPPDGGHAPSNASPSSPEAPTSSAASPLITHARPKWLNMKNKRRPDEDEDVPESLILEQTGRPGSSRPPSSKPASDPKHARAEAQWRAAQAQQGLHESGIPRLDRAASRRSRTAAPIPAARPDPRAEATWLFTNAVEASSLDTFLLDIYQYFVDHGIYSITLSRAISLLMELFVFSLAMFLTTCVDYSKIPGSKSTSEILVPQCMRHASWLKNAALFLFIIYWLSTFTKHIADARRLHGLKKFYDHLLGIDDQDIQTTKWSRVVEGLTKVTNANIATADTTAVGKQYLKYTGEQQRLTAETIANRLMRKSNYYVALYNKDILDFTLPIPFMGSRQFYSKSLEWCIDFCFTNFIFDERGSIRPFCLEMRNRAALVEALRLRLRVVALFSIIIAPVNIFHHCVLFFFKYYTEFTRNPSRASTRSFTPLAEWKIRQFNEIDHLFRHRIRQAYPFANEYLKQFPKDKTDQICRFVAFVSGAIAAVLALATLLDPELFLGFEVSPGRTAVFWLGITGVIFGVANGALPEENEVHDPVLHLTEVLMFLGSVPGHWKGNLHTNEVRAEFSAMYQMKVLIFLEEILSFVVAPLVLWKNSVHNCERVVDFFRAQTVHVEGVGYQCNFAVFNFKKDARLEDPQTVVEAQGTLTEDYYGVKDDKMAASMQNFRQYYSQVYGQGQRARRGQGWQPPPAWPPMQRSAIPEEEEPYPGLVGSRTRIPSGKRTAAHDARQPPSASAIYSPRQAATTGRRRGPPDHGKKRAEAGPAVSESRIMAQDSDLYDFAEGPGPLPLESDTDGEDKDEKGAGQRAGVLGILYELSKAQADKATGMNI